MDPLEQLCTDLLAQGFHAQLAHNGLRKWTCELTAGIEVLKPEIPRPRGSGETALAAVDAAQVDLAEIRKRLAK